MSEKGAIFNLVRESTLASSETFQTDYVAGADSLKFHDEIELVTPDGEPCAMPVGNIPVDLDYRFNYSDGSRGRTLRAMRRRMVFSIDYIDEATRNRLEMWMNERARFMLSPGFGRYTEAAWRPIVTPGGADGNDYRDGTPQFDLTGNRAMGVTFSEFTNLYLWDLKKQIMRGAYDAYELPIFATPAGAGAGFPTAAQNRFKPWYPKSVTAGPGAGNSGWDVGGTDSADITFIHVSDGFGNTDCPDSLKVRISNLVSTSRYIIQKNAFNSAHGSYQGWEPTGDMTVTCCTFLKGRFPAGAQFDLRSDAGSTVVSVDLDGYDLSEWTPIIITMSNSSWPTGSNGLYTFIGLESSPDGIDCEFEIGPTFISGISASGFSTLHGPIAADDTSTSSERRVNIASVAVPQQGTVITSFYLPTGHGLDFGHELLGLFDSQFGSMKMELLRTTGNWTVRVVSGSSSWSVTFSNLDEGLHSFAFVWSGERKAMFMDGDLIGQFISAANQNMGDLSGAETFYIGYRSPANSWPLQMLTWRLDRKVYTDDQIGQLHAQLTDPGTLGLIVPARGRIFEIKSIPATPRVASGGTHWLGTLEIEQVDYDHNLADLMTQEIANV